MFDIMRLSPFSCWSNPIPPSSVLHIEFIKIDD